MLSQEKFNKLSKYALRLEKAYNKKNSADCMKYCSHLKYHIGGDGANANLDQLFNGLIEVINSNPEEYKLKNIQDQKETFKKEKDELVENNEQLKNVIERYNEDNTLLGEKLQSANSTINSLNEEKKNLEDANNRLVEEKKTLEDINDKLVEEKENMNKSIERYKEIIQMINSKLDGLSGLKDKTGEEDNYKIELEKALEEFTTRLNEKESMCKLNDDKIIENNNKIAELENEIKESNAKIKEQETLISKLDTKILEQNDDINALRDERDKAFEEKNKALDSVAQIQTESVKSLKELSQKNYLEFKSKLTELFKAIYPETIANAIVEQMNVGERTEQVKPNNMAEIESRRNEVKDKLELLNNKKLQAKNNPGSLDINKVNDQINALNNYVENGGIMPSFIMKGGF